LCLLHFYFFSPRLLGFSRSLLPLLNHLIRPDQHIRRDRQADLLRRLAVDDHLELHRLLKRRSDDRVLIK